MAFNDLHFWLVFPFVFGIYWLLPLRYHLFRKVFLILASYLLYLNWKPFFAIVLLSVTMITYTGGYVLGRMPDTGKRKALAWSFALLGFLPLFLFKYYNFLNDSISQGLSLVGLKFNLPGLNWAIPVGISFYSFQAVGYMLDVYHKRMEPETNLIDYLLFTSFFPQVVSGPVSKAEELLPQIRNPHKFNYLQAVSGLKFLLWGMFLKVVVADRAGLFVDRVFNDIQKFSGIGCGLASVFYSIQIYADFSGYSLMAVGVAKTLGFNLIENFKRPYFSCSVTEFWHRWHISLTRWLKDYVYIPLGGSRCSSVRTYRNIFIVFLISGIWHGANWTFIVWGVFHGVCQIVERMLGWNSGQYSGLAKAGKILLTFTLVTLAWVVFRSPSIGDAWSLMRQYFIFSGTHLAEDITTIYIFISLVPLVAYEVMKEFYPMAYLSLARRKVFRRMVYVTLFCMVVLFGVHDSSSFIYVNF